MGCWWVFGSVTLLLGASPLETCSCPSGLSSASCADTYGGGHDVPVPCATALPSGKNSGKCP